MTEAMLLLALQVVNGMLNLDICLVIIGVCLELCEKIAHQPMQPMFILEAKLTSMA